MTFVEAERHRALADVESVGDAIDDEGWDDVDHLFIMRLFAEHAQFARDEAERHGGWQYAACSHCGREGHRIADCPTRSARVAREIYARRARHPR